MRSKSIFPSVARMRLPVILFTTGLAVAGCGGSSSSSGGGDAPPEPISGCDTMPNSLTSDQEAFLGAVCGTTGKQFAKYNGTTKKSGQLTVGTTDSKWSVSVKTGWGSTVTLTSDNAVIDDVTFVSTGGADVGDMLVKSSNSDKQIKIAQSPLGSEIVARSENCEDYLTNQSALEFTDSASPNCSAPGASGDISGLFFFSGDNGNSGKELWKTDGTKSGTSMVKDIAQGMYSSHPYGFLRDDNKGVVYFTAKVNGGKHVYQTDGTEAGTGKIASFDEWDTADSVITVLNDTLYLTARYEEGGDQKIGLFKTDGSKSGTSRLTSTSLEYAGSSPKFAGTIDDRFIFSGANPDGSGKWIVWISDGTEAGTKPLKLERNSNQLTIGVDAMFDHSQMYQGKLYFGAALPKSSDPSKFDEVLIGTDGTAAGTEHIDVSTALSNTPPGGQGLATANGKLFFNAKFDGSGPYMMSYDDSDGVQKTPKYAGTSPLRTVTSIGTPTAYNDRVYFYGKHDDYGSELFSWNGDNGNSDVELVKDINQGTGDADPGSSGKAVFKNALFFIADENDNTRLALWKTDGTEVGTAEVNKPTPKEVLGDLQSFVSLNRTREIDGKLLFFASGADGCELWTTDGEKSGTDMVKDINPGPGDGTPNQC